MPHKFNLIFCPSVERLEGMRIAAPVSLDVQGVWQAGGGCKTESDEK